MAFGKSNQKENQVAKDTAPVAEASKEVAETKKASVPAFMQGKTQTGAGASTKREDNQVPMVYTLQSNSPQVNKRDEAHVEGAEPGDLWMRNASRPIVTGTEGFKFQPCAFITKFVQWTHRDDGGGWVASHDAMPKDAKEAPDRKNPEKMVWMMPDKTEIKETKYYTGWAEFNGLTMPYVVPCSSTNLTESKKLMGMVTSKMNDDGVIYNIFTSFYKVKTRFRKKGENSWFVFDFTDLGYIWDQGLEDAKVEAIYARGESLHEAVMSGEVKFDEREVNAAGHGEESGQGDNGGRM